MMSVWKLCITSVCTAGQIILTVSAGMTSNHHQPMENELIRHVMTFEGKLPDDAMKQALILGNLKVHAARDALSEAFKEAGCEHAVVSKTHREGAKGPRGPKTPATVAPIQEPQAEPAAEESTEARHSRRAAA